MIQNVTYQLIIIITLLSLNDGAFCYCNVTMLNVNGEVVEVLLIAKQWPYVDRRTCYGIGREAAM